MVTVIIWMLHKSAAVVLRPEDSAAVISLADVVIGTDARVLAMTGAVDTIVSVADAGGWAVVSGITITKCDVV